MKLDKPEFRDYEIVFDPEDMRWKTVLRARSAGRSGSERMESYEKSFGSRSGSASEGSSFEKVHLRG